MDERRRKTLRNIYIVVGVSALLLIAMVAAWYMVLVRPQNDKIVQIKQEYETRKAVADTLPAKLIDKAKAEEEKQYVDGQLAFLQERYRTLYFGEINGTTPLNEAAREQAWRRWMNEYYSEFGVAVRRELVAAANDSGVIIRTTIKVDAPPKVPEEVQVPPSGFLKPTSASGGTLGVTVQGAFPDILRFLNRINLSRILLSVGNISLSGQSPSITATFSVTPFLLATGPGATITTAAPAAPAAGAAPGADAAAGEPMPGGVPVG